MRLSQCEGADMRAESWSGSELLRRQDAELPPSPYREDLAELRKRVSDHPAYLPLHERVRVRKIGETCWRDHRINSPIELPSSHQIGPSGGTVIFEHLGYEIQVPVVRIVNYRRAVHQA